MTTRAIIHVPAPWLGPATYALREMANLSGISVEMSDRANEPAVGSLTYAAPDWSGPPLRQEVGTFLVHIPYLGGDDPSVLHMGGWDVHTCLWEDDRVPVTVRSPLTPLPVGRPLARWSDGRDPAIVLYRSHGRTVADFSFDAISSFFLAMTQRDEGAIAGTDVHGRIPQARTFPIAKGVALAPIATDSALLLRRALAAVSRETGSFFLVKAPWPSSTPAVSCITHDVDSIRKWTVLRLFGQARRRFAYRGRFPVFPRLKKITGTAAEVAGLTDPHRNLVDIRMLERQYGIHTTYFFQMARRRSRRDPRALYGSRDRYLQQQMRQLKTDGHELGLHGTYESAAAPTRLVQEVGRLSRMRRPFGARQHYLRIHNQVWSEQESLGLLYDSSVGYSEFVGFRSGACHPYHPFDSEKGRGFSIYEIPFPLMDSALYDSCIGNRKEMERLLGTLAEIVASRNGVLVSIWHNQYLDGALLKKGSVFDWFLSLLTEKGWQFWTMEQVARWWTARNHADLRYNDPHTWSLVPNEDLEQLSLWCYGARVSGIDGLAENAWAVLPADGFSILSLRGLRASSPVTIHGAR